MSAAVVAAPNDRPPVVATMVEASFDGERYASHPLFITSACSSRGSAL